MNAVNSPIAAVTNKKRVRRENRRFADGDRIGTSFVTNELIKALTKTPTRAIPDITGFTTLTKNEIKRDTKDIEKACGYLANNDVDFEGVMDQAIQRSLRPTCNPESTILDKKRRLVSWVKSPEEAEKEMLVWEQKVNTARDRFKGLEAEKEEWFESFQAARRLLLEAQQRCTESNNALKSESVQLIQMCSDELELGGSKVKRRRGLRARDLCEELSDRQAALEERFEQLEQVVADAATSHPKVVLPVVTITVSELNYPEDSVNYKKKSTLKNKPANAEKANGESRNGGAPVHDDSCMQVDVNESKEESVTSSETQSTSASATAAGEKSSSPTKTRSSGPVAVKDSESVDDGEADSAAELMAIMHALEESVRQSEASLRDLDVFFAPDRDEADLALFDAAVTGRISVPGSSNGVDNQVSKHQRVVNSCLALSAGGGSGTGWMRYIDSFFESHGAVKDSGTVTRKKKKVAELAVPLRAGVRPRTDFDVALLLSPLSQYQDRLIGTIAADSTYREGPRDSVTGETTFHCTLTVPVELRRAEDDAMERCRLQSAAAAAQLKIAQLTQANTELVQITNSSAASLRRIEQAYKHAVQDDLAERARIRKELVYYGVVEADPSEPPLSPMTFLPPPSSAFGGVGVARNGSSKSGSRNRNGHRSGNPRNRQSHSSQQLAVSAAIQSLGAEGQLVGDVLASLDITAGRASRSRAEPAAAQVVVEAAAEPLSLSQTSSVAVSESVAPVRRRGGPGSRGGAVYAAAAPAPVEPAPVVASEVVDTSPAKPVRSRRRQI